VLALRRKNPLSSLRKMAVKGVNTASTIIVCNRQNGTAAHALHIDCKTVLGSWVKFTSAEHSGPPQAASFINNLEACAPRPYLRPEWLALAVAAGPAHWKRLYRVRPTRIRMLNDARLPATDVEEAIHLFAFLRHVG
jgi:hypothetical protein